VVGTPGGGSWGTGSGRRGRHSERGYDKTEGRLGGKGDEAYWHREDNKLWKEGWREQRGKERRCRFRESSAVAADEEEEEGWQRR